MSFDITSLDYLQQIGQPAEAPSKDGQITTVLPSLRRLWRIEGIGVTEKQVRTRPERNVHLPTQDLLIGLYGLKIPVAFLVIAEPGAVSINLGTWMRAGQFDPAGDEIRMALADRHRTIQTSLQSAFHAVELAQGETEFPLPAAAGLVLGVPTIKLPDPSDGALPMDRLFRSLTGCAWGCLILAEPVAESLTGRLRLGAINEMKNVQAETEARKVPDPLADYYSQLLGITLTNFTYGLAIGMWRTAVYLLGDDNSYGLLAGAWQGVFSGEQSLPVPIRIMKHQNIAELAVGWKLPDTVGRTAPGKFQYPAQYQTLLTSDQLAAYIHLPRLETKGFTVKLVPQFDVAPEPVTSDRAVQIGTVMERTRQTEIPYRIAASSLSGHVFVTGVTGSGKTNTVFHLLREAFAQKIGCLVIEPAKKEYRALLDDKVLGPSLRVFTAADESLSPVRLNPFEVMQDAPIGVHLDLLRSVFSSSFGMWVPLPQILEKCMLAIYEDRGWDVLTNRNRRLKPGEWNPYAFPTLSDLVLKIGEIVPTLGFDPEANGRILASLTSRVNGLRSGGKGRMFDVQESISMDELLRCPTVLELESMGDDDDKAFIIGLLLTRLVEYRRLHGPKDMQHILVVEEAHRLLANVSRTPDQEQADPKGKAVETFSNLLSEIRAYGQGILIADQVPTRLAPDVIKNTNLKIAHRIVSGDDREILGKAMAMSDRQIAALSSLQIGEAAVFSGASDDAPILVHIKPAKTDPTPDIISGDRIRKNIAKMRKGVDNRIFRQTPACEGNCPKESADDDCRAAASLLESAACRSALSRLVLSIIENPTTAHTLWEDIHALIQAKRTSASTERIILCFVVRAAAYIVSRRGAQAGWSYKEAEKFETALRDVLLALSGDRSKNKSLQAFQKYSFILHKRNYPPFPSCELICTQGEEPVCLYRFAAADLLSGSIVGPNVNLSLAEKDGEKIWRESLTAGCKIVATSYEALSEEMPGATASVVRAGLCYLQQAIRGDPDVHVRDADELLKTVIKLGQKYDAEAVRDQNVEETQ